MLQDGSVLKGEIVSESETEIVIRTLVGEVRVSRALIKLLEREEKDPEGREEIALQESFGEFEDQVAGILIGEVADPGTKAFYKALSRQAKGPFLAVAEPAGAEILLRLSLRIPILYGVGRLFRTGQFDPAKIQDSGSDAR